ncbi:MAG: tripartite tricarboxylate transporter substrate binding protein [Betaproteobacteria bacterium]|nr:tripartite tricarboxylate transporter substrate binding protein [Betaproteobacteria bacterium]
MRTHAPLMLAAALAIAAAVPQATFAQAYPSKPVRLIVPYAPGGATDIIARAAAIELSRTFGQPVNVDNRAGAGGNLGAEQAAKAAPDGYTMLMSASSLHGITPFLYSKLNYDPNKDLVPVIVFAAFANVLVLNPGVKANSVKEVIELVRSQPGQFTYASSGSGSTIHMSGEMFTHLLGLKMTHVPYKGSGPAVTDLIGGQVHMMFDNIPSAISHIRSGKLRALATTGPRRAVALPDLPTMIESGVAGFESTAWFGLVMPAGTPREIVARMNAEGQKAARSPEFVKRMTDLGYEIVGGTPDQMASMIQDEIRRWGPIVKASGAKAD